MLRILLVTVPDDPVFAAVAQIIDAKPVVIPVSPEFEALAMNIFNERVLGQGGKPVDRSNAEAWLEALPWMYHGSRFYALQDDSQLEMEISRDGVLLGYVDLKAPKYVGVHDELREFFSEVEERGAALKKVLIDMGYELATPAEK